MATGVAVVSLDTTAHRLVISITASGFTPVQSGSHIPFVSSLHLNCCVNPPGIAGDVTLQVLPLFGDITGGTRTITVDTSAPPGAVPAVTWHPDFVASHGGTPAAAEAALAAGLAAGDTYVNIATTEFGLGEIRGFFNAPTQSSIDVPALSLLSVGLLVAGLLVAAGIALHIRRNR
jgi:CHRD domain-containing protein